uniref:Uncharacterized protein n=1 Tax=Tanacetum cinerariifolium TaxID=118510 RepID=A0A699UMD5_TANCI|nr:hypothetical protein [Tanacetum cinerariifolium]
MEFYGCMDYRYYDTRLLHSSSFEEQVVGRIVHDDDKTQGSYPCVGTFPYGYIQGDLSERLGMPPEKLTSGILESTLKELFVPKTDGKVISPIRLISSPTNFIFEAGLLLLIVRIGSSTRTISLSPFFHSPS